LGFQLIISDSIASVCCTRPKTLCKSKENKNPKRQKKERKKKCPHFFVFFINLKKKELMISTLRKLGSSSEQSSWHRLFLRLQNRMKKRCSNRNNKG
jgi:hypothetical protein